MKIRLLCSLFFISTLALACATGAENRSQDVVYLGSELVLDETAGQKVVPLQALITRITELAPAEELTSALTSLAKQLADGTDVVPKSLALDAVLDARDLLVKHNDQVASDDELKTLNSQLEFYQTAIENDMLTDEYAVPDGGTAATRYISSPNVALYVTGSTGAMAITLGDPTTTDSVDLISKAATGITTVDGGTVNLGYATATTINMGKTGGTTAINVNGGDPLRFINPSDPTKYVGFKGGSASGTTNWTLPTADGISGYMLQTNGAGALNWTNVPTPENAWPTTGNALIGPKIIGSTNGFPLNFVTDGILGSRMSIAGTTPYAITTISQIIANGSIDLPSGLITASTVPYIHRTGISNFFAGTNAGNLSATLTADNLGIGAEALLTIGGYTAQNTAVGCSALRDGTPMGNLADTAVGYCAGLVMQIGTYNTLIGSSAGLGLKTGSYNVLIGASAGAAYNGSQSSNICIGTGATGAGGDNGVINLGVPGTQTSCYIAGVDVASATAAAAKIVGVDGSSQLVTSTGHADGFTLDDTLRMSAGRYAPAVPYGSAVTPMIQYGRVNHIDGSVSRNSDGVTRGSHESGTGLYVINYVSYGTNTPVVIATPEYDSAYNYFAATIPGQSSCTIYTYTDTGVQQDISFNLYIIGVPA